MVKDSTAGHRSRLLDRYLNTGIASLNDYEILELLLAFAIPRRDTKPIAKKLMASYGTVSASLSAPLDELCEVGGLTGRCAALLTLVKDMMAYSLKENCVKRSAVAHRAEIEEYLRFAFGHCREEYVAAVFIDGANRIICAEVIESGSVKRCGASPRKIMDRALKCGAAAFILAHNHPAGIPHPSEEDWRTTELLMTTGKCMDVPLIDHLIISKDNVISLREYDRWPVI